MSQLIALIIAIALGAIVTAIGYVFLGDAFTQNSERGVALQMVNQASQVEMAMTAYRAENARTAYEFDTDAAGTWTATQDNGSDDGLVREGYLKDGLVAPQGAYTLVENNGDVFLLSSGVTSAVCEQVNRLAGGLPDGATDSETPADGIAEAAVTTGAEADTALNGSRYACFESVADNATATNVFAYEVE